MSQEEYFDWKVDFESKNWDGACERLLKAKGSFIKMFCPSEKPAMSQEEIEAKANELLKDERFEHWVPDIKKRKKIIDKWKEFGGRASIDIKTKGGYKQLIGLDTELKFLIFKKSIDLKPDKTYFRQAYKLMKDKRFGSEWNSIKKKFSIPVKSMCFDSGDILTPINPNEPRLKKAKKDLSLFCQRWRIEGMMGWVPVISAAKIEIQETYLCVNCGARPSSAVEPCCHTRMILKQPKMNIEISKYTSIKDFGNLLTELRWRKNVIFGKKKLPVYSGRDIKWLEKKTELELKKEKDIYAIIAKESLKETPEDFARTLMNYAMRNWGNCNKFLEYCKRQWEDQLKYTGDGELGEKEWETCEEHFVPYLILEKSWEDYISKSWRDCLKDKGMRDNLQDIIVGRQYTSMKHRFIRLKDDKRFSSILKEIIKYHMEGEGLERCAHVVEVEVSRLEEKIKKQ